VTGRRSNQTELPDRLLPKKSRKDTVVFERRATPGF